MAAVAAAIVVVPLVVYLKVVPLDDELYGFWNGQRADFDFFSFYKSRILIGLAAVSIASLFAAMVNGKSGLRQLPLAARLALAGYAVLAVASAWGSPFRNVALNGFPDRYEGLFVLLSYIVITLASFAVFTTPARVELAARCVAVSAMGVGVIGLLQYAGVDPLRSAWGQRLILPSTYDAQSLQLQYPVEARTVYSTLFHYDYVGSYTALALPFLLAVTLGGAVSRSTRRLAGAGTLVTGLVWLASGSRAGLAGGALALVALAVGLRSRVRVRWPVLAASAAALVLVLALIAVDVAAGGRVRLRAASIASDIRVLFSGAAGSVPPLPIEIVRIEPAAIHLKTPNGALLIRYEAGNLSIFDEERLQPLAIVREPRTNRVRIDDTRFSQFACSLGRIGGKPAFVMRQDDYVLNFLLLDSGIRLALKTGRPLTYEKVETFGFEGRETLGSARGYIWSRSLPLLKRTLLTGYGPDTFAMVFPQQDLVGKFRVYGTTDMVVDKVHNLFLQTALNTGVLSALLLATLFLWYLVTSAQICFGGYLPDARHIVGLACFAGVAGYLGAGLFNDSIVGVAPVFWALLGLGIRLNVEGLR
jgi:O-Antigen ligase